jgi:hypothetical protein
MPFRHKQSLMKGIRNMQSTMFSGPRRRTSRPLSERSMSSSKPHMKPRPVVPVLQNEHARHRCGRSDTHILHNLLVARRAR